MNNNLMVWGKGGHASVVVDQASSYYNVVQVDSSFGMESVIEVYPTAQWKAFVAIGDNHTRRRIQECLFRAGYTMINIVSGHSWVSDSANLGLGIFVAPGAIVQTKATIGNGVILNTNSSVDHDCVIEDFAHIAPGSALCGNVKVGHDTLIGVGTSVIPKCEIASDCIVAGGSSVNKSLFGPNCVYAGNPCVLKSVIQ